MNLTIEEYGSVKFTIETPVIDVSFDLFEPYKYTQQEWEDFATVMKLGNTGSLVFCNSNGEVYMSTSKGCLTFYTSKHGAGGDGMLSITIKDSYEMFSQVLKKLNIAELKAASEQDA